MPEEGTQAMAKARPPGWWYPWIFVAGMLVVVAVNGVMIYFATSTWTGLETSGHYFEKGVHYNQALAGARAQQALGWRVEVAREEGTIAVTFRDPDGRPLDGLNVRALMVRPTHEGYDFEVAMVAVGSGLYRGAASFPLPGQWEVRVVAYHGDDVFQEVRRIMVPREAAAAAG